MRNKHLLWTRNNIITTLLLPLGHIPFIQSTVSGSLVVWDMCQLIRVLGILRSSKLLGIDRPRSDRHVVVVGLLAPPVQVGSGFKSVHIVDTSRLDGIGNRKPHRQTQPTTEPWAQIAPLLRQGTGSRRRYTEPRRVLPKVDTHSDKGIVNRSR
jgi:hypothetical protein